MEEKQREGFRPGKNKIDIKSMDDQLQKHLDRVSIIEMKKKEQDNYRVRERVGAMEIQEIQEWEIDPEKLVINEPFARGTFASVHRGLYNGQPIAVKVLDWGEEGERTKALQRDFQREVSAWYKLEHVNITKCIGATTAITSKIKLQSNNTELSSNSACVITEYLSGGTLKSYLIKYRERKLPIKDVLQLALDLARGLSYLHSKNIVHRDVKTENLLLDKNRMVKIADFGVARLQASNLSEMTGSTGTLGYMAPENLRPQIPKSCPSSLAKVMKRCWDAEPSKRPEMDEVVTMLEAIDKSKHPHGCFCFSMPETK
ncbi:serine/threonine-protein kinase STY13 isoform X2 [Rosa chinensis]|uniref:serine/threonine-protein kinase STY13 isoform X2 n=1 Tax=Rosa chinensis TaxID=74649 RepID=UPI000D09681F|nr:serine/threonine-protein kinase STY13 isoform X2 [Rosa chinensis]